MPFLPCSFTSLILTTRLLPVFVCIVVFIGYLITLYFHGFRKYASFLTRLIYSGVLLVLFACIGIVLQFIIPILYFGIDDIAPSANYHPLNALIKTYCLADKTHKFCPHTSEEVVRIAPEDVRAHLNLSYVTYRYYPESNDYTLLIRDPWENKSHVAFFDSRLPKATSYGNHGLDIYDPEITPNCNGTYTISNPPPFSGPWNTIK